MLPIRQLLHPSNPRVLVAAHRGAWQWTPENSLAAIEESVAQDVDIVELDVRCTVDGVLVLMHDERLDRMTTLRGPVETTTFALLREGRLRASDGGPHAAVTSLRVPTLAEAMEAARDRIAVNIDTKDTSLAAEVAQAVVAAGMSDQIFVKAEMREPRDAEAVRANPLFKRVPFVPMMTALPGRFERDLRWMQALDCPMYEVAFAEPSDVEAGRAELERQQARLWINTINCSHSMALNDSHARVDPDAVWGRLLELGAGAIQTDDAAALVAYLQARGRR